MAILTFENIMEADDITEKEVPVPEWGGSVVVRSITHRQMNDIKNAAKGEEVDDDFVQRQVILKGLVQPRLTEEQVEKLWDKNTRPVMTILNEVLGQSKTGDRAVKEEEKSIPPATE